MYPHPLHVLFLLGGTLAIVQVSNFASLFSQEATCHLKIATHLIVRSSNAFAVSATTRGCVRQHDCISPPPLGLMFANNILHTSHSTLHFHHTVVLCCEPAFKRTSTLLLLRLFCISFARVPYDRMRGLEIDQN